MTVEIKDKYLLTVEEAVAYTNIGRAKLKEIMEAKPELVVNVGVKKLIKRNKLEKAIDSMLVV